MIRFVYPEAFLLAAAVLLLLRGRLASRPLILALRAVVLLAACALLAEPWLTSGQAGRDVVLVVDRSKSMPAAAATRIDEIVRLVDAELEDGDRLGVVAFGRDAVVVTPPTADLRSVSAHLGTEIDDDGTDLAGAIDRALAVIPPGRQGSLLIVSDGEVTGPEPNGAARAALRRGIRIDALPLRRRGSVDVSVADIRVPTGGVEVGEPFVVSAWVHSDVAARDVPFRVLRDGEVVLQGRRDLRAGRNRFVVKDRVVGGGGLHRYSIEVLPTEAVGADGGDRGPVDRRPENDRAHAVVLVQGAARVLCVTPNGREDRLTSSLRAAGLHPVVVPPQRAPLTLEQLDGFRAVILENVAADDLPAGGMRALRDWVRELGGGLLMTGGKASFGPGGYYRSPVEEALPVTMEVRQEHRKFALAMAVVLDRSGSMQAAAGPGVTKMDLANLGTIEAVRLLGRADSLGVIAVDSAPHVVVPMTRLEDPAAVCEKVATIESSGGGIYVNTGIKAAARELVQAPQTTKHIVLFADAADAEEPGDYATFVPQLVSAGVTVSVIGLGQATDSDAAFLEDLAAKGQGRCTFVADPTELPRVFAQETIQVARSSFAEDPVAVRTVPDLVAIGDLVRGGFPALGGYSIAYLDVGGTVGLLAADDTSTPILAFGQVGLGRSAAFLGEVDGEYSGDLASWPRFGEFFATITRWIAGSDAGRDVWAEMRREGHDAVLSIELADGSEDRLAELRAAVVGPDGEATDVWLQRVDDRRLEARIPLRGDGVYRAVVATGDDEAAVRVPPITLPYSPEFAPRVRPDDGVRCLERVCTIAEGRVDPPIAEITAGDRASRGARPIGSWFAWLLVAMLLAEIAVRRLDLRLPALPRLRRSVAVAAGTAEGAAAPVADARDETTEAEQPDRDGSTSTPPSLTSVIARAQRRAGRRP